MRRHPLAIPTSWPRLLGVWLLGCLLLGLFHLAVPDRWRHANSIDYQPQVQSLLDGRGFLSTTGQALTRYPPVYPMLLASQFFMADAAGLARRDVHSVVTVAMASLAGVLAFLTALLFVRPRCALAVGMAVTLMPHFAYATLEPLSLVPYTACMLSVVFLVLRELDQGRLHRTSWALIGLLTGLMMLIRPIAILLPLLIVAVQQCAFRHTAVKARTHAAAAFVLALLLTLLPWEAWTYSQRGNLIPLSTGGSVSLRDGISFDHKDFRTPMEFGPRLQELQQRVSHAYTDLNRRGEFRRFILDELRRDPIAVAQLYALKSVRAWYGTDAHNLRVELAGKLFAVALLLPTLFSLVLLGRRTRPQRHRARSSDLDPLESPAIELELWSAVLIVGLLLYHWAFATVFVSIVRYMVPVFVLLPILWCIAARVLSSPAEQ